MYIEFIDKKIEKLCLNYTHAVKKLGQKNAKKLFQRMSEIKASNNLKVLMTLPNAKCHRLHNNRKGQCAVSLAHPKRLILLPETIDGEIIDNQVEKVTIIEIVDYH
jgi:plasmid maintenance system killer protein